MITPEQHSDLARRPATLVQPADHLMTRTTNLLAAVTRQYLLDADAMIIRDIADDLTNDQRAHCVTSL